jgi:hypothetical protein
LCRERPRFQDDAAVPPRIAKPLTGSKTGRQSSFSNLKENPFDPRLGTHKILRLSSIMKRTVYAVEIQNDLRSVFYIAGDVVISFDIGRRDIYKK